MKIHGNEQILKNLYPEAKTAPQAPAGNDFGSILKESVENVKQQAAGTQPATWISSMNGVQMLGVLKFDKQNTLDRIENLIGLLDQYRLKLADPGVTLRNMDPIIKKIHQETENLTPVLDSLPQDDDLKNIINQTLVTASLEVGKFYRGDYIAA